MGELERIADALERIADRMGGGQKIPEFIIKVEGDVTGPEVGHRIKEALEQLRQHQGGAL